MPEYRIILLNQGKVALVDAEDYERVNSFTWHVKTRKYTWYAMRIVHGPDGNHQVLLHRFILDALPGVEIDHKNMDGLDCRKANLRPATHGQNGANRRKESGHSSMFKGVRWSKDKRKWRVEIQSNSKQSHVGYFENELVAAKAYDSAAIRVHGEFAQLNFATPDQEAAGER